MNTSNCLCVRGAASVLLAFLVSSSRSLAAADCAVTLNVTALGWYDQTGRHDPANLTYIAGAYGTGTNQFTYRNWFAFDVPTFHGTLTGAELRVERYSAATPDGTETYELHEVATPVPTLRAGGAGLTGIYADLGDGLTYGTMEFGPYGGLADWPHVPMIIPLTTDALSGILAAQGTNFVLGGTVTTLSGNPNAQEYTFFQSYFFPTSAQLILHFANWTFPRLAPFTLSASGFAFAGTNYLLGGSVLLFTDVCGTEPVTYRWYRNGTLLNEANPGISLGSSATHTGNYFLTASNAFGASTSETVHLSFVPIYIRKGPLSDDDGVVALSTSIYLNMDAYANAPIRYQWRHGGMPIPGQTNSVLALMNLQFSDSGPYDAVLSCSYGSITSRVAQIDVRQPPRLASRRTPGGLQITVSDGTPGRYRMESFTNAVMPWNWDWMNYIVIDIPSMPHTIDLPINPLDGTRYYRLAAER